MFWYAKIITRPNVLFFQVQFCGLCDFQRREHNSLLHSCWLVMGTSWVPLPARGCRYCWLLWCSFMRRCFRYNCGLHFVIVYIIFFLYLFIFYLYILLHLFIKVFTRRCSFHYDYFLMKTHSKVGVHVIFHVHVNL